MVYQRPNWHADWDEKKSEVKIKISELKLYEEYEPEVIQAALLEYLQEDLRSELKERFGEKQKEENQ